MEVRQGYTKGINQDLSKVKDRSQYLYSLENGRIVTKESGTAGEVQNFKGNINLDIPFPEGHTDISIIGYTEIDNDLILFTTGSDTNPDCIWRVVIDYSEAVPTSSFIDYTGTTTTSPLVQLDLNFSIDNPIFNNAVTRFETGVIQHIYWTDNENNLRHANIAIDLTGVTDSSYFDIVSNVDFTAPEVSKIIIGGGSFECGLVQYSYYLLRKHGNRTMFSPASPSFHLVEDSDTSGDTTDYTGCAVGTDVSKALEVTIDDLDTDFDYIRVYRLAYEDAYQVPAIGLAYEGAVTDTVIFTDTGVSYDTLTTAEYNLLSTDFSCKTMAVKDDRLFTGNIKDQIFNIGDYDSRIYRYNKFGYTKLLNADGTDTIVNGVQYELPTSVDVEHDCINPYNDLAPEIADGTNWDHDYQYQYNKEVSRVGGSGVNIDFKIESMKPFVADHSPLSDYPDVDAGTGELDSFSQFANPKLAGDYRSYARDETYRFSIRWINDKGQKSFPQWMCDIRMPMQKASSTISPYNNFTIFSPTYTGGGTYVRQLQLEFMVRTFPTGAVSYEIMRVEREDKDKTILGMGMLGCPTDNTGAAYVTALADSADEGWVPHAFPAGGAVWDNGVLSFEFVSPEIAFNKIDYRQGDYFTILGTYGSATQSTDGTNFAKYYKWKDVSHENIVNHTSNAVDPQTRFDIEDASLMSYGGFKKFSGDEIRNYGHDGPTDGNFPTGYKRLIGKLENIHTKLGTGGGWGAGRVYLTVLKRNTVQYGGNTYEARANNYYIPCNAYFNSSTINTWQEIWGGDSWVTFFEYIRMFRDTSSSNYGEYSYINCFPVESTINLELRHDTQFYKSPHEVNEGNEDNYYKYNDTFSREADAINATAEPLIFNEEEHFNTRVRWSDVKYNGELVDNWTIFKTNNYKDLETEQGALVRIIAHKNKLFGFQYSGIASLPINERAVVATTVGQTELGTGGILETYEYVTKESGTKHPLSIVNTGMGVMYYDSFAKDIKILSGTDTSLAIQKGISSKLAKIPNYLWDYDNTLSIAGDDRGFGVLSGYDKFNKEAFFSFNYLSSLSTYDTSVSVDTSTQDLGVLHIYTATDSTTTGFNKDIEVGDKIRLTGGTNSVNIDCNVVTVLSNGVKVELDTPISSLPTNVFDAGYRMAFNIKNNFTVVFDEKLGAFTSFDTFVPSLYLENGKSFMSIPSSQYGSNPSEVYIHREGVEGRYYGIDNDMIITVIVDPHGDIVKSYNNLEYLADTFKQDGSLASITPISPVTSARFKTNYQHSGAIDLSSKLKRKIRTWRLHIPRSLDNMFADGTIAKSLARMRDSWIKIDLICENDNKKVFIKDLNIGYLVKPL